MNTLLLFTGGEFVVIGGAGVLAFIQGYIWSKGWIRSYLDRQGGRLHTTIPNGNRGRLDLEHLNNAADEAVKQGLGKRPQIRKNEERRIPRTKKRDRKR